MVIELSGVQFWSEIILVISNRTMISDQIALQSVQVPLQISMHTQLGPVYIEVEDRK